jgi:hypothetical protein
MSPLDQMLEVLTVIDGQAWISLMIAMMVALFFVLRFLGRD